MTQVLKQARYYSVAAVAAAAQGMMMLCITILVLDDISKSDEDVMTISYFLRNILSQTYDDQANQENQSLVSILQLMNLK